jgi:hypothetical protein
MRFIHRLLRVRLWHGEFGSVRRGFVDASHGGGPGNGCVCDR